MFNRLLAVARSCDCRKVSKDSFIVFSEFVGRKVGLGEES